LAEKPTSFGDQQMSQQGQWQVAGSAPEVYERELVPAVFGPWAPILIDLAHPKSGDRVIDIACGTGIVARLAAARVGPGGAVAGVDLNPGMLNVARSLLTTGDAAPVQWQEASADRLPFPDGSFVVAYCQLGLQFFADRPAAWRESYVAGSPLAGHVSQESDPAREKLKADTKLALEKYVSNRGLSFPIAAHLLTATA
jgi:SAM-dependent methyltransferase